MSKNITKTGMDLILEVRTKHESQLVNDISELEEITAVSMLLYDGEVKG